MDVVLQSRDKNTLHPGTDGGRQGNHEYSNHFKNDPEFQKILK
jgi:hypothetical protein